MRKIAITMGEPGGIGPEVIVKALSYAEIRDRCVPVVIGNVEVMKDAVRLTGLPLKVKSISGISESKPASGIIEVLDVKSPSSFKKNASSKNAGKAVIRYIKKAVELALKNEV